MRGVVVQGNKRGFLGDRTFTYGPNTYLLAWRHSGLSAHVGEPIEPGSKHYLEDAAAYLILRRRDRPGKAAAWRGAFSAVTHL